jgi:ribosome maturation factor RimP
MDKNRIRVIVAECVERQGAHLIELVVRGDRHQTVMEVFIDSEVGVTTDFCSRISREISTLMRTEQLVPRETRLVVSSPGIDRPLRFGWQYRKHLGRELRVKSKKGEEIIDQTARLLSVDESGITLQSNKNSEPVLMAFDTILEARVQAPW